MTLKLEFVKTFKLFPSNEKRLKDLKKEKKHNWITLGEIKSKIYFFFLLRWHEPSKTSEIATDDDDDNSHRFCWMLRHSLSYRLSCCAVGNVANLVNYSFIHAIGNVKYFHHQKEFLPSRSIVNLRFEQKRASESFQLNKQQSFLTRTTMIWDLSREVNHSFHHSIN